MCLCIRQRTEKMWAFLLFFFISPCPRVTRRTLSSPNPRSAIPPLPPPLVPYLAMWWVFSFFWSWLSCALPRTGEVFLICHLTQGFSFGGTRWWCLDRSVVALCLPICEHADHPPSFILEQLLTPSWPFRLFTAVCQLIIGESKKERSRSTVR